MTRCPIPTQLQVYEEHEAAWTDILIEDGQKDIPSASAMSDAVRNVIQRMPEDSEKEVSGIKVKHLSPEEYQ